MTPLEEIERSISVVDKMDLTPEHAIELLGPLYQARAIERLEASVRAIGVSFQEATGEGGIIMASFEELCARTEDAIRKAVLQTKGAGK